MAQIEDNQVWILSSLLKNTTPQRDTGGTRNEDLTSVGCMNNIKKINSQPSAVQIATWNIICSCMSDESLYSRVPFKDSWQLLCYIQISGTWITVCFNQPGTDVSDRVVANNKNLFLYCGRCRRAYLAIWRQRRVQITWLLVTRGCWGSPAGVEWQEESALEPLESQLEVPPALPEGGHWWPRSGERGWVVIAAGTVWPRTSHYNRWIYQEQTQLDSEQDRETFQWGHSLDLGSFCQHRHPDQETYNLQSEQPMTNFYIGKNM